LRAAAPNDVWCADFKGQFPTGDGQLCYPLTVTDAHSRYLLACRALPSVRQTGVFPAFQRLFADYGLPRAIRTDNGAPFATQAVAGLSKLSVWWIKLGIAHQRIEPGCPEQNGRHERMHRTLKAETARPPRPSHAAQQRCFDRFRREFNDERPHEALGQQPPATRYAPSPRPLPARLPPPDYPGHWEVRRVSRAGTIRFQRHQLFVSDALIHEDVGLVEVADGVWSLYFYHVLLARLDERDYRIRG
jgi:transposase InsO family protein